MHALVDTVCGQ